MATPFDASSFLSQLATRPGVYCFKNATGQVLYVGKAGNLRQRLTSYFLKNTSIKIQKMVAQISDVTITITQSEKEALLLEIQLIKQYRPRYNVLFRDDKSYPYFFISADPFPRMIFYRGARKDPGHYFGPYPETRGIKNVFAALQKVFQLRNCDNHFFASRTRPCLQYQIHRCSAPCVGNINEKAYRDGVDAVKRLLQGERSGCIADWTQQMHAAAAQEQYEEAGYWRDLIAAVQRMMEKQIVCLDTGECDVWAVVHQESTLVIHWMCVREGKVLHTQSFFPQDRLAQPLDNVLAAFMMQYYAEAPIPPEIAVNVPLLEGDLLMGTLTEKAGHRVMIAQRHRGPMAEWTAMALQSAQAAWQTHQAIGTRYLQRRVALERFLGRTTPIAFMECFDISHWQGHATMASCVAFHAEGPDRKYYRRYTIETTDTGDDYQAMKEVLTRHYQQQIEAGRPFPDIIVLDGGQGQMRPLVALFEAMGIVDCTFIGIAKGVTRRPGNETLWIYQPQAAHPMAEVRLAPEDSALLLLQHLRDEAHRYALRAHQKKREKESTQSVLEQIPGIGPAKRQRLLAHFGGLQDLQRASQAAIAQVPGIHATLAERIYIALHGKR